MISLRFAKGSLKFSAKVFKDAQLGVLSAEWCGSISQQSSFSQKVFEDVFSDLSKDHFIKSISSLNPNCGMKMKTTSEAAVMVPLCKVRGEPSVLLTVRSPNMGRNKGDISFPGGMKEPSDKDVIDTALRETEEEIGISSNIIQIWTITPSISRGHMKVTPVVAFIDDMNIEKCIINPDEVEQIFSLTLESLCNPCHFFYTEFQNGYALPVYVVGKYRVWGLTAYILHRFLQIVLPDVYKNNMPESFKHFEIEHKS